MDLRWTWNHSTDGLWRRLDAALWERTRHPSVILQTVAREKLTAALADPGFRQSLDQLVKEKRQAETAPAWFQQTHPPAALTCVAYFCMEFMLTEALPIYSGGLGNVAGDQLKAASDLGVPVVAVGLLYQHGYFRQVIDRDGAQQALYRESFDAPSPDAYETLLWDVMKKDATLFMRADQVEAAWQLLLPVLDAWSITPPSDFPNYAAGTWGPESGQGLLERQEHRWPQPTELTGRTTPGGKKKKRA